MVNAAVYLVELNNINSGQRLVFNVVTNNLARFIREWNAENVLRIWQVTTKCCSVRVKLYEEKQARSPDNKQTSDPSRLAVHRQVPGRLQQKRKRNRLWGALG